MFTSMILKLQPEDIDIVKLKLSFDQIIIQWFHMKLYGPVSPT